MPAVDSEEPTAVEYAAADPDAGAGGGDDENVRNALRPQAKQTGDQHRRQIEIKIPPGGFSSIRST